MDPEQLLPYINFQKFFEVVRNKTNADMRIIRDEEEVEEMQAAMANAKAAATKKEQDIAQQDADTRTFSALANAENSRQQAQGSEGQNPPQQQSRYSGLTFAR